MIGHYCTGAGQASSCCAVHTKVFNTKMIGTYNIHVPGLNILKRQPSIILENKSYWFIQLKQKDQEFFGWAIRDKTSNQRVNVLEILTKVRLPESLKPGNFEVSILTEWDQSEITKWALNQYWFQGFPFASVQKADSAMLWETINVINWSGLEVLDYGCHYGYFSFEASKRGASVTGVDSNHSSLKAARIIRDNIIQQDVKFIHGHKFVDKSTDVVLYLSVHHQIDPNYKHLIEIIKIIRSTARKYAFIELIMPPMFPKDKSIVESDIDDIIDGKVLKRYKHNVRGYRKVYFLEI